MNEYSIEEIKEKALEVQILYIKKAWNKTGQNYTELAERLGVTRQTLQNYKNGCKVCSLKTFMALKELSKGV